MKYRYPAEASTTTPTASSVQLAPWLSAGVLMAMAAASVFRGPIGRNVKSRSE
jgi:hypothetical protein